ncbi:Glucan 1,3-beta-glucosidase 3 [Lecanora helva]
MKFLDKVRGAVSNDKAQKPSLSFGSTTTDQVALQPPTAQDVLRYRSHHGANLGSIFVLEKWLFPSMFETEARGDSELAAVTASLKKFGVEGTRHRWEQHWTSALSDAELDRLAFEAGITSLRLPIGYFTFGDRFTNGTPFATDVAKVYKNGWDAVLKLCERLHAVGIGVLLDLHALPGNANTEDHGGVSTRKAELWGNRANLALARKCLAFMVSEVAEGKVQGCAGIQLCNEACWGAKGMYQWYESCIQEIETLDANIPLYVSDAWDLKNTMEWSAQLNRGSGQKCPVGVATSKYYAFTEQDKSQSPQQIIERASEELSYVAGTTGQVTDTGAAQVMVTEWSCCMTPDSWAKASDQDRDKFVRQFGKAQRDEWRRRAGGAFFWTAKMQWMDGGEWGVFEMMKKGALTPPSSLRLSFDEVRTAAEKARREQADCRKRSVDAHTGYWDRTAPGTAFEHWRFEEGWDLGFTDALAFFEMRSCGGLVGSRMGADTIGCVELWIMKRLRESKQSGGLQWEWEHGFRQGVGTFNDCVLPVDGE